MSNFSRSLARKKAKLELKQFKKQNTGLGKGIPLSAWMTIRPQKNSELGSDENHVHTENCEHNNDAGKEFLA
jgi:hypothetical protein